MSDYKEYQLNKVEVPTSARLWLPSSVQWGPGQPLKPSNPDETPRRYDYQPGRNLFVNHREGKHVTYSQMRELANTYGILRTVIEQRKDEIRGLDWAIGVREDYQDKGDYKDEVRKAQKFFERPDLEHTFDQWLGMLLEDLFVTDTACLFKERNLAGDFRSLQVMDGTTITCLVDDSGRIPDPPIMAYEQRIAGLPRTAFSKPCRNAINDQYELYYRPYNTTSNDVYGFSHVESILYAINIALRKDIMSLNHFTEGNIPRGFIQLTEEATKLFTDADQVKRLQNSIDTLLSGNPAQQSKITLVPGVSGVQMLDNKVDFDGTFEEWLARIVCARFGVSPAPYSKMMNRATAQTQEEARQEYSLIPMTQHFKAWFDEILDRDMNMPYLEFVWDKGANYDSAKASSDLEMLHNGVITINDIRAKQGLKPLDNEAGRKNLIWTGAGVYDLDSLLENSGNEYNYPSASSDTSPFSTNDSSHSFINSNNEATTDKRDTFILSPKAIQELAQWKRFELSHLNRPTTRKFETKYLSEDIKNSVRFALQNVKTAEEIKSVFNPLIMKQPKPRTELDGVIDRFANELQKEIDDFVSNIKQEEA